MEQNAKTLKFFIMDGNARPELCEEEGAYSNDVVSVHDSLDDAKKALLKYIEELDKEEYDLEVFDEENGMWALCMWRYCQQDCHYVKIIPREV